MTAFWFVLVLAMQQETTCLAPLVDSQRMQQRAEVRDAANAVCSYFSSWQASDYQDARARSAEAARRNPNNPIAHYLIGLLAIRGRDLRVPGLTGHFLRAGYTQTNAELEGRRALERALAVDERFGDAARALAELAIYLPTPQNLEIADRALQQVIARTPENAALWLDRSEIAWLRNDRADAVQSAQRAAQLQSNASVQHALAAALMLPPSDGAAGAQAYLSGLAELDSASIDRYLDDVRPILRTVEAEELAGINDLSALRRWLTDFWQLQAATANITIAERLAEQLNRARTAQTTYRRSTYRLARQESRVIRMMLRDPKTDSLPFDDRGLLFMRLGRPDTVISSTPSMGGGPQLPIPVNESWVYHGGGPGNVYHFFRVEGYPDFAIAGVPECVVPPPNPRPPPVNGRRPPGHDWGLVIPLYLASYSAFFESRAVYEPQLGGVVASCYSGLNAASRGDTTSFGKQAYLTLGNLTYRADAQRYYNAALNRVAVDVPFRSKAPLHASAYAFRTPSGGTELVAALIAPAELLRPDSSASGFVYSVDLSIIAIDSSGTVVRRDTTQRFSAQRRLLAGEFLRMQLTLLDVTPGVNDLRIILRNTNAPEIGQGKSVARILPDLGTSQLSISDIVLAEQPAGSFRRGAISLALRPTHQFAQAQEFTLFYELHGLPQATQYRTNVEFVREPGELAKLAGKRGETRFAADFRDTSPPTSGTIQQLRRIQSNLTPGTYLVRVTVTAGRDKIVRETTLKVVESGNR
jgi:hypothetical protein